MKIFLLLLSVTLSLFGVAEGIKTFQASFTQTVRDDLDKTITYSGTIIASRPNLAKWEYLSPVKKSVFIDADNITIIEPDLEQVIVKKLEYDLDLFKILSSAKPLKNGSYLATYHGRKFTINMDGEKIRSILYSDDFDNRIQILFSSQKINDIIDNERFVPIMPKGFDLLTQ